MVVKGLRILTNIYDQAFFLGKQQDVFQVKFEHIVLIVELGLNYIAEIRPTVETLVQQLNKKFFVCFRSCVSWTTQLSTGCGS